MTNKLILKIKRFDTSIALPAHQTAGSVGFDLSARIQVTIPAQSTAYVPLNVAIQPPEGCWVLLAARSSLHKKGLVPINGVGIVDSDYCGDEDEYTAALYNITQQEIVIEKGERIVQAVVMSRTQAELEEVETMSGSSRGGFGSTGHK